MTNNDISKAYMGVSEVDKIYLGTTLIYPTPPPEPDYSAMPLTFEIISAGTIGIQGYSTYFNNVYISASTDNGATWQVWQGTSAATTISVRKGDKIMFKGDNVKIGDSSSSVKFITGSSTRFKAYGNPMSLLNSTGFSEMTAFTANYALAGLFHNCNGLVLAKDMVLPVTSLREGCYANMFNNCQKLVEGPFLPAQNLVSYCYANMFENCSSLNKITCLADSIPTSSCTYSWVLNVSATGTFIKSPEMEDWTRGANGIPNGWTVRDATCEEQGLCENDGECIDCESLCNENPYNWYEEGVCHSCINEWESLGYASPEECAYDKRGDVCGEQGLCLNGSDGCTECEGDPCDDWENMGYESFEDCSCQEYGVCGDPCDDWDGQGYSSYEECNCAQYGECWNGEECVSCEDPGE